MENLEKNIIPVWDDTNHPKDMEICDIPDK